MYFVREHIMNKPTLLFISMGELATHLLEAVARTDIFETIVVSSRDLEKAKKEPITQCWVPVSKVFSHK